MLYSRDMKGVETRLIGTARAQVARPAPPRPRDVSQPLLQPDGFSPGAPTSEVVLLPKLVKHTPQDAKRGYLWQAVPLPGPIDGIVGALISIPPLPSLLGLEPAPRSFPEVKPLVFSWTQSKPEQFAESVTALEALLRDPKATEAGKCRLKAGSNANYLVSLDNGVSAIWSPKAGEKSPTSERPNIPAGTQSARDEAAYLVDRRLGHLARVPPAVSSGLEGRPGSLKLLVSQAQDTADDPQARSLIPQADYRRIALFDHIIGNLDRHGGNLLLDGQHKPIPIDHGLAFPTQNGEQGHTNFNFDATFQLNDEERTLLQDFSAQRAEVKSELRDLLEPEAVTAMFERVDRMLELNWISHEWRGSA